MDSTSNDNNSSNDDQLTRTGRQTIFQTEWHYHELITRSQHKASLLIKASIVKRCYEVSYRQEIRRKKLFDMRKCKISAQHNVYGDGER